MLLSLPGASALVIPIHAQAGRRRTINPTVRRASLHTADVRGASALSMSTVPSGGQIGMYHTWSPQDLTKDKLGFEPIPDDDYIKRYQGSPGELWPVEFFLIAYRRTTDEATGRQGAQVLVRKSANGTSRWGVGSGVPATRWLLSTQPSLPRGYEWQPLASTQQQQQQQQQDEQQQEEQQQEEQPLRIRFEARHFPEFPAHREDSWAYDKIAIRRDAFHGPDATEFADAELEEYASRVRDGVSRRLSELMDEGREACTWEATRLRVVKDVVDRPNSLAAIQGALRMSGLFAFAATASAAAAAGGVAASDGGGGGDGGSGGDSGGPLPRPPRYVALSEHAADPAKLGRSMRIYTMFPQMPDPMPSPSTSAEELQAEIDSRDGRMAASGRDPHKDRHGRRYTHRSTSNVSNTIHGVYLTIDVTGLPGLDVRMALEALSLCGMEHAGGALWRDSRVPVE